MTTALGMRLRLESGDGPAVKEYRIERGNVEVRSLHPEDPSGYDTGTVWRRLTPEELSIQVEGNTVVAQWLERRLGWRRLLQACVSHEPNTWSVIENTHHPSI
jgi:hypothetical protein